MSYAMFLTAIFTAIQKHGIKLDSAKGPVDSEN